MTKNTVRTYFVLGIILIVFSAASFLLPFEMHGVFWVAYICGVLSIFVQTFIVKVSFGKEKTIKSKFYGLPIAQVGFCYMVVQIIISIVCMIMANFLSVKVPILINILVIAIAAIGFIATDAMRDEIERQDTKLLNNVRCMQELRSKTAALPAMCEDEETKKRLQELAERFKYSDPVSADELQDIEKDLSIMVDDLQDVIIDGDVSCAVSMCKKIMTSLDERNRLCKLNKR